MLMHATKKGNLVSAGFSQGETTRTPFFPQKNNKKSNMENSNKQTECWRVELECEKKAINNNIGRYKGGELKIMVNDYCDWKQKNMNFVMNLKEGNN